PTVLFFHKPTVLEMEDSDALIVCPVTDPDVSNFTLKRCHYKSLPEHMTLVPDPQKGITIKNVQRSFLGCYRCVAQQDGVEKRSKDITLVVRPVHKSLPSITLSKTNQLLKEGEEFEVTCTIRDIDSSLQANWIFQGNANLSSKSKNVRDYEYEQKLTLSIRKGYVSLSTSTNTTLYVNDGENLGLVVTYEAYPKPEEEIYSSELHLTRLKEIEGGLYTFFVSNSDANSSITFNVYVNTKPEIVTSERLSNGMLLCVASGYPAPTINWYVCPATEQRCHFNLSLNTNVKTKYKDSTFSSFGNIIVESTIDTSMFKSNSTVTCEASNTIDRRSAFFNFAIKEQENSRSLFTPLLIGFGVAAGLMCVMVIILVYKYLQEERDLRLFYESDATNEYMDMKPGVSQIVHAKTTKRLGNLGGKRVGAFVLKWLIFVYT
ncbi:hypothetical protein Chor_000833, partial [Crotalus horridus]